MQSDKSNNGWKSRFQALGPGILMASAAVGGSHIIASTQAGAIYGWQLAIIIILANLFKYPFFRFGVQYTLDSGNTLLEGYRQKGKIYLWIFFLLNIFSTVINVAAISLLCAVILTFVLPFPIPVSTLSFIVIVVTTGILLLGKYRFLDSLAKLIMISLTVTTLAAVLSALMKNGVQGVAAEHYISPSPWNLSALAFIVALMGWMPAPIEISAINSMWVVAKRRISKVSYEDGIFDFNIGYIGTAILALIFLALGALVQFGSGEAVQMVGGKYIAQLINMYASTIGEWARELIAFIAFMCIFGTTISVVDGYSRTNVETLRLLMGKKQSSPRTLNTAIILAALSGLTIIFYFNNAVGPMLKFAMIGSFVSTPVFAWLNLSLVMKGEHRVRGFLLWLSLVGLVYLAGFTLLFIASHFGWIN
ncbi:NRAMP family divalent metal transporter [Avibacterium volantium]|uniref:Mn2+ and Fe2+ transporters of the NRAMP family n=1 Tax=Avibacterium volantium TaxID=762 RepID=A0A3S5DJ97_AVIVO|nr:NRAMP family divalent metal transporter [Avibacterium volantium]VEB23482.1 Mn2+ and Fe2+ transporters of the NRAMP family [Avibacterium volantium]